MAAEGDDGRTVGDDTHPRERESVENVNVFADAFAAEDEEEEEFDFVADGFRPGGRREEAHGEDLLQFEEDDDEIPGASTAAAAAAASRDSTRKGPPRRSMENPFANPAEDGNDADDDEGLLERTFSGHYAPGIAHRLSTTSSQGYARTGSPRFGAGGPSHPYAMYPQGIPRSPSYAASSHGRPSRQSTLRDGPQHPYTLYPQGVDDEDLDDEVETAPQNPVPMGFLGLGQSYQRRLGPDGEEQDIIGDYGHAEQLPPYSRYPEAGPEKMPLLAEPTALHSRAPVMGTDPGMALMHTQLRPELPPQSMTDQSALLERHDSRHDSRSSMLAGSSSNSRADSLGSKKTWSEKSWSERRKMRFCGIPLWLYMLALGTLTFIAAVLGGVIGGFVEGQEKSSNADVYTTVTSLYDASVVATLATATVPPTGSFKLALGAPQATQSACLPNVVQRPAWSCDLAGAAGLSIEVSSTDSNVSGASFVFPNGGPTTNLYYGTQASQMWTHYSPFIVVKDNDAPQEGLAYYLDQRFNKWVVVPEAQFDAAAAQFKRGVNNSPFDADDGVQPTNAGDKPWFCYWNSTLLEVFVYIHQPVSIPNPTSSSAILASTPTTPPSTGTSATNAGVAPTNTATNTSPPVTAAATLSTTLADATTTFTYTGPSAGYSSWYSEYVEPVLGAPTGTLAKRHHGGKEEFIIEDVINDPTYYPFLIKVEERRLPGSPQPYCVQYQILENGSWNYAPNPNNTDIPYTVYLTEDDPPFSVYESAGIAGVTVNGRRLKRAPSDSVPDACHCQWMSGQGFGV